MQDLSKVATFLRSHPDRQVVIEGHTDSRGSDEYNQRLSRERADAVREYLVGNGVTTSQISSRGYGEAYPVASNATEAGRLQNRRVDIVIGNPGDATAGTGRRPSPATAPLPPSHPPIPGATNPAEQLGDPGALQAPESGDAD
jgi:hypothetical protein